MAFGSGILVSALTFDLMEEAFETGGVAWVVGGFALGALVYVVLDYLLDRMAARSPKREGRRGRDVDEAERTTVEATEGATVSGMALLVGAVLDAYRRTRRSA